MMDYEYQEKKKEIYQLKYIVFEIYIFFSKFHKFFCVCEYKLRGCQRNLAYWFQIDSRHENVLNLGCALYLQSTSNFLNKKVY
jgi:hypothetical protein